MTYNLTKGLHWYHWLVVGSSLVLTFIAWYISHIQVQEKIKLRFDFQSDQLLALISERMKHYEDALRSGVAFVKASGLDVDVNEWRLFAETLRLDLKYPGINGFGLIYYVSPDRLDDFLEEQRKLRPKFANKPTHEQPEYWPITYVEPVESNAEAVGLDMAFETNRWTAAKLARDLNETQITAPITLVQDSKKTPGFLQFVPVYRSTKIDTEDLRRKHFLGHVYAPFIMSKLMEGTLEQRNRKLLFRIFDGDNPLYDELTTKSQEFDPKPMFEKTVTLDMYGRPWTFSVQTALTFRYESTNNQPLIILFAGLFIDTMLLALFILLTRAHKSTLALAKQMSQKFEISEKYYRNIIESAPCGIVIVNKHGLIDACNHQVNTMFFYDKQQLIGKSIDTLVPNRYRASHVKFRDNFMQQPTHKKMGLGREIFCLRKDNSEFPGEIGLAHFKVGSEDKIIVTVIDITDIMGITNELKRSNRELDDFAYVASHDLKAPLRGITQLATWIAEDIEDTATDETLENLTLLKNRTCRLENLLDDLLAYSRVGRKDQEIKPFDVMEKVSMIFDLLNSEGKAKLEFKGNMPQFSTFATPLELIFRNLISNTFKHCDRSDLKIVVACNELTEHYEFSVEDNGPGIKPEHHQQIFELFKTLRPRDEVEGSGMGLSIIKKILEWQGQSIRVVSNLGSGTKFIFTWPKTSLADVSPQH